MRDRTEKERYMFYYTKREKRIEKGSYRRRERAIERDREREREREREKCKAL